jgi:CPA1 family monovalent cation:H+ antiporter
VHDVRLLLLLLTAIGVFAGLARVVGVAYPVMLLVGGIVIGLIPGVPALRLAPEVVFVVFLPPLVYSAAYRFSTEELREQALPIARLAIGLVLFTMAGVAVVAHQLVGLDWRLAFLLGAILGPTDPVAATTVVRRLGAPERLVTVLEGESLVNDGTALTAYTVILGSLAGATLSPGTAIGKFVVTSVGGIAIGVAVGWLYRQVRQRVDTAQIDITLSLLTAYAAYIAADELGASGILASVAAGLVVGQRGGSIGAETRLQAYAFWDTLTFLLNSVLFLLVGVQIRQILRGVSSTPPLDLIGWALAISAVVILLRLLWMYLVPTLFDVVRRAVGGQPEQPSWREQLVIGWSGMRGVVSMAAALALPTGRRGLPADARSLLIFLTYATIVVTLVVPGLTLAPLVKALGLGKTEERRRQAIEARLEVLHAALARLEEIASEDGRLDEHAITHVREDLEEQLDQLEEELEEGEGEGEELRARRAERELREQVIGFKRQKLEQMRREARYPQDLLREIEHDLDLEESRVRRT